MTDPSFNVALAPCQNLQKAYLIFPLDFGMSPEMISVSNASQ